MRLLGWLLALAVSAALVGPSHAADKAAKKKKKGDVVATVVKVSQERGKEAGTLTVKTAAKKGGTGEEKTFKVSEATKIEVLSGKKGNVQTNAGKFADLAEGKTIHVTADGDAVKSIRVLAKKKKK